MNKILLLFNMNNYYNVETFDIIPDYPTSFESNPSIDMNLMTTALNNIINNCKNNILQKNKVELSALATATNIIQYYNVNASRVIVGNIDQTNNAYATAGINDSSTIVNTVSESISSSISKQINNDTNNNNLVNQQNSADLLTAMNGLTIPNDVLKPSIIDQIDGIIGLSPTLNDVNLQITKMLNIDDSVTINDSNKVTNDIQNIIEQINYIKCEARAAAINKLQLIDVDINANAILDDFTQYSRAEAILNCTIDQENISTISNKIITNITTNINNLYTAIKKNPSPNKYKYLNLLSKAISNKIIAGGTLVTQQQTQPSEQQSQQPETQQTQTQQPETQQQTQPQTQQTQQQTQPQTQQQTQPQTQQPQTQPQTQQQNVSIMETYKYFIISGLIIVLIIIIIIIIIIKK